MEILDLIKNYWSILIFVISSFIAIIKIYKDYREATKCVLRNDILQIYDKCKTDKQITKYQLETYTFSRDLYFRLKGDGFVHRIDNEIMNYKIID